MGGTGKEIINSVDWFVQLVYAILVYELFPVAQDLVPHPEAFASTGVLFGRAAVSARRA